jgi:hypothetical protein
MGLQQHRERRYGGGVYLREERSWFLSSRSIGAESTKSWYPVTLRTSVLVTRRSACASGSYRYAPPGIAT